MGLKSDARDYRSGHVPIVGRAVKQQEATSQRIWRFMERVCQKFIWVAGLF